MLKKLTAKKCKKTDYLKHETKRHIVSKFLIVLIIFIVYFIFISQKYGTEQGLGITILTWSFFVLCTPIADAGFLLDFPIRLITNIKMLYSEILVWLIAISLNIYTFFNFSQTYSKTKILILFKHILQNPFPFWIIIILSALGTFISIQFGDELLDNISHKDKKKIYQKHIYKYKLIVMFFLFASIIILYDFLLKKLGINLPL